MAKPKRDPKSVELANRIIEQYQPESVENMQNALKDLFGPMFEAMLKGEMNHHLGYGSNDKGDNLKIDFMFKQLFGEPSRKHITITFLNGLLGRKYDERIIDLTFENTGIL